ncbi:hypothetical protein ACHAQA_010163 [Verticillium albo-atrum]
MTEAQRNTMALQMHQSELTYCNQHDSEVMAQVRMELDHKSVGEELDLVFIDRRVVHRPRKRCNFMGCRKAYQKKEHLKRHQRAAHGIGGTPEMHTCPAVGCRKVFKDRLDNFKQHLRIHKNGKSTRTPCNEEAAQLYDKLCKYSKVRNVKKGSRTAKG